MKLTDFDGLIRFRIVPDGGANLVEIAVPDGYYMLAYMYNLLWPVVAKSLERRKCAINTSAG